MREIGVDIRTGVEVGKDVTIEGLRKEGYKGFYVAIGCQGGRLPGIPGDSLPGTSTAIDFLHGANTGKVKVSGKVVVVGGGNVAIDLPALLQVTSRTEVYVQSHRQLRQESC